jgi:hypothetical protein
MTDAPLPVEVEANLAEHIRIDTRQLRDVRPHELATRFGFGFAAAAVAGTVTLAFGNRVGGLFLAFPAILPASITLIAKKHGRAKAEIDAGGATIGALSMVGFAALSLLLIGQLPITAVEVCALAAWFVLAVATYLGARTVMRRRTRRARTPRGVRSSPAIPHVSRDRARG